MSDRKSRRLKAKPCAEALETRNLLTGGAGNTFAIIPVTIATANGTATVPITIDPTHFTLPNHKFALGVDTAPADGSSINPLVTSVTSPHGTDVPQGFHSIYNPHLSQARVAAGAGTGAFLVPLSQFPRQPDRPATYTVNLAAFNNTSGKALVGFYLPGDANGDGKVDAADITAVRAALGSKVGDSRYNFDADANRDGRIGKIDLAYVRQNQGVATTVTPLLTAQLDPASDTGTKDRITTQSVVHFAGVGTPGATVVYHDANNTATPNTTTTVNAAGQYSLNLKLAPGMNSIQVTTVDAFGQTITGSIQPVQLGAPVANLVPAPGTSAAAIQPSGSTGGTTTNPDGTPNGMG